MPPEREVLQVRRWKETHVRMPVKSRDWEEQNRNAWLQSLKKPGRREFMENSLKEKEIKVSCSFSKKQYFVLKRHRHNSISMKKDQKTWQHHKLFIFLKDKKKEP